ncbi:hypothetical protein [Mycobacterium sp. AZCC_0083]|uniref:hypothetical protein n=1 Tax=Mycobacterium sp. AZCC_0083 TaxID=2735882 RepID=UPI0017AFCAD2|nr:hypothetical protein [Mycobacterium sp. AZCC_0083]MBB5166257.1 hypothetical protein [Mycobacterium sp. AZCC_0083]
MNATAGRRLATMLICAPIVVALDAGCGKDSSHSPSTPPAVECINVVDESGKKTDECLPIAPGGDRVDLVTPVFSKPIPITNPLHPTSEVKQVIMGGQVDGKPFRTEVTLLPGTKPLQRRGQTVDTAIIQYVAYSDGRIHEVAIDSYAQADDGSVWYFGEDVSNFEDGKVADTKGTWVASDKTPAAMIMPAMPAVGNIYRPENAPEVVFEEVRVQKVNQTVAGPSGNISGAIEVMELHMDGTREGKVFAPGYGEFSTGSPGGELEAVSLAVPTDSRQGPAPAEFGALSAATARVFEATASVGGDDVKQAASALGRAWEGVLSKGIPPQMASQMKADIEALNGATNEGSAQAAALRIAQNELDLRLLYQRVIDVDLAKLALWARELPVDVAADDAGFLLADVAALDRVWERTRHGVQAPEVVDGAMQELRQAADAEDLSAVDRAATALTQAVDGLRAR